MAALNIMTGVLFPLWALGHCFFGYIFFRVALAINGLAVGFHLGAYILGSVRPSSTVADVWVAGIVGGILLMLAAWFLYRILFAAGAGWMAAAVILHAWPTGGTAAWIVAALAGVVLAGLAYVFLRELVTVVTAFAGAGAFVVIVVDQWFYQGIPQDWAGVDIPLTFGTLITFVLLAAAGLTVQFRTRRFAKRFGPPARQRRDSGDTSVRPKFIKV
jgi:hypothetical protein